MITMISTYISRVWENDTLKASVYRYYNNKYAVVGFTFKLSTVYYNNNTVDNSVHYTRYVVCVLLIDIKINH